jgi:serine/threonine protein kinase
MENTEMIKRKNLQNKLFISGRHFMCLEKLGKGAFGSVYKVQIRGTDEIYAIKKIKLDVDREGIPSATLREISILKSINHPNIVKILGLTTGDKSIEILLEYHRLDLRKFMEKYKTNKIIYNLNTVRSILYQIIRATNYLHSRKILHRDLKLDNVLFCDETVVTKLVDFGLSRVYTLPVRAFTQNVLTLYYRAPELLLGIDIYSIAVDLWSIGCIFAELLIKIPLFLGDSELGQLKKIYQVLGTPSENIFPGVTLPNFNLGEPPLGLDNFILKNLQIDMDETSLVNALDLLKKLLAINPYERISAKEALNHVFIYYILILLAFLCECNDPKAIYNI